MGSYYAGSGGGLSEEDVQVIADAAEDAAAVYTDTAIALRDASDIMAIPFRSTEFYLLSSHTGLTTGTPANRAIAMMPFRPGKSCTLSKLAVEQTIAGEAGSKIRLLIFDDVDGLPTNKLWESSDIAGDGANGEKSEDPNLAIVPSKLYYAGLQCHTAVTTRPTFRYFQSPAAGVRARTTAVAVTGRQGFGYAMASDATVTNPLVAGTVSAAGGTMPAFWLQAD
jgi:hypothetical protein